VGVRRQPLSHLVHASIRTSGKLSGGKLTVDRLQPSTASNVIEADLPDIDGTVDGRPCIPLFDVKEIQPVRHVPPRPHSEMEIYRVHLRWNAMTEPCCADIAVVDCDVVLACYEWSGRAIGERWRESNPDTSEDSTWHGFLTDLARNGANALCDEYRESAIRTPPRFGDHRWTACVSTVLAEDYYRVFGEDDAITPDWGSFLRAGDEAFGTRLDLPRISHFLDSARAFANAHTRDGVRRAAAGGCGRPTTATKDLEGVADVLIKAQKRKLGELKSPAYLGQSLTLRAVQWTFATYLRQSLREGLGPWPSPPT